jgi:hypothetical protein
MQQNSCRFGFHCQLFCTNPTESNHRDANGTSDHRRLSLRRSLSQFSATSQLGVEEIVGVLESPILAFRDGRGRLCFVRYTLCIHRFYSSVRSGRAWRVPSCRFRYRASPVSSGSPGAFVAASNRISRCTLILGTVVMTSTSAVFFPMVASTLGG